MFNTMILVSIPHRVHYFDKWPLIMYHNSNKTSLYQTGVKKRKRSINGNFANDFMPLSPKIFENFRRQMTQYWVQLDVASVLHIFFILFSCLISCVLFTCVLISAAWILIFLTDFSKGIHKVLIYLKKDIFFQRVVLFYGHCSTACPQVVLNTLIFDWSSPNLKF